MGGTFSSKMFVGPEEGTVSGKRLVERAVKAAIQQSLRAGFVEEGATLQQQSFHLSKGEKFPFSPLQYTRSGPHKLICAYGGVRYTKTGYIGSIPSTEVVTYPTPPLNHAVDPSNETTPVAKIPVRNQILLQK